TGGYRFPRNGWIRPFRDEIRSFQNRLHRFLRRYQIRHFIYAATADEGEVVPLPQLGVPGAHRLPHNAFQPVPMYRVAALFAGDNGVAVLRWLQGVLDVTQYKRAVRH